MAPISLFSIPEAVPLSAKPSHDGGVSCVSLDPLWLNQVPWLGEFFRLFAVLGCRLVLDRVW